MPRYFFDTSDNGQFTRDDVGVDLHDDEAARSHIAEILPAPARSGLPNGGIHSFECTVRDEEGRNVYHSELTYRGRHLGPAES